PARPARARFASPSVPPLAGLEVAQGPQEVDLAELRPVRVAEVELAVDRLPRHETGQPDLAGGPDHEVGVRHAGSVEVRRELLGAHVTGDALQGLPGGEPREQQLVDRVDDLLAAAVAERDVEVE